jgi:hypothetical protein
VRLVRFSILGLVVMGSIAGGRSITAMVETAAAHAGRRASAFLAEVAARPDGMSVPVQAPRHGAACGPRSESMTEEPFVADVCEEASQVTRPPRAGSGDTPPGRGAWRAATCGSTDGAEGRTASPGARLPVRVVSSERVLAIAQRGQRPEGVPAGASRGRPAGVRLTGVTQMAVGVFDGDVVTHVDGGAVGDPGEVVARVLAALGRRQASLRATVYRGTAPYDLVVGLPVVPRQDAR